jgi:hypothetical protein
MAHWAIDIIRSFEDQRYYGDLTLKFRDGVCVLIEEKRTIQPPKNGDMRLQSHVPSERIAGE